MNTQRYLEEIIYDLRSLASRLEYELNGDDTLQSKVEEFLRDIPQAVANLHLNLLVRQLMREERRTVVEETAESKELTSLLFPGHQD